MQLAETQGAAYDDVGKIRAAAAWGYETLHHTLDVANLFLNDAEAAQAARAASTFLVSLQKLAAMDRRYIWKLRPKHHQLDHAQMELSKSRLNMKRTSCLLEEDFLSKIKKISMFCRGVSPLAMSGRILDRYCLELALRWHERATTR